MHSLTQFVGEPKVNDLYEGASGVDAHNVLRFEVQVDDALLVDILDPLQNLLHVAHTDGLGVLKVVIHDALKQLSTSDTADMNIDTMLNVSGC